jgi:plasmid stabilization system protein ParE
MPAIEVEYHPEARREYLEALAWYIACSETVGRRFQEEIRRAVQLISEGPERWPMFEGDIRWIRLTVIPTCSTTGQPERTAWKSWP